MAQLDFAPSRAFVWTGDADEAQRDAYLLSGWTRTTLAPPGVVRYFTADYAQAPMYNPWAALPFYSAGTDRARERLAPLAAEYEASFALDAPDPAPMPPGEALLPFQRAGVAYALRRENALIGDPMGLGKSIQAVACCNALEAKRILVLCPANVVLQWRDYMRRWLVPLGRPVSVFAITGAGFSIHPSARVVICSYDRARGALMSQIMEHEWDVAILDEAHYLRNHTAARTRAVLGAWAAGSPDGIAARARRIFALTGTPLPNRPRECYTLGRALDFEALGFMSEETFQDRFNPKTTLWVKNSVGIMVPVAKEAKGRLPELNARLRCSFMVRRDKDKAAPQLPAKRYSILRLDSKATADLVAAERLLDIDVERLDTIPPDKVGHVAALRREMGVAMAPLAAAFIADALEAEPDPLVLFAYHREVIGILEEKLKRFRPVVVTGSTSVTQRRAAAVAFETNPAVRLFIGQLTAAGTGIDGLQRRADTAVFVEPSWVPGENEQCVDRLHRMGQARPVHAQFLAASDSWNERILSRAIEKLRTAHQALDVDLLSN